MISITSVISFAIVLLAASSYSAPIDKELDSSKLYVKKPIVNQPELKNESIHQKKESSSSEEKDSHEMTTEGIIHPTRGLESKESYEVTTELFTRPPRGLESKESGEFTTEVFTRPTRGLESDEVTTEVFTRPPRGLESDEVTTEVFTRPTRGLESDEVTTEVFTHPIRGLDSKESGEMTTEVFTHPTRGLESKESDEMTTEVFTRPTHQPSPTGDNYKRTVEDFLYTTLESSTEFNKRAIRPVESGEVVGTPSPFPSHKKKSVDDEPSSVQTFGKSTGLLKDETNDQSNEEPIKKPKLTKPVPIIPGKTKPVPVIPGKVSETKTYTKLPNKPSGVIEPVEQEQLSQVQH